MMCQHQVGTNWSDFQKHHVPKASLFPQSVRLQERVQYLWMPQIMDKIATPRLFCGGLSKLRIQNQILAMFFFNQCISSEICAGMDLLIGKQIWQYGCVAVTQRSAQTGFFEMEQICKWTCVCSMKRQWLFSLPRLFLLGPTPKSPVKGCVHSLIHESIRRTSS